MEDAFYTAGLISVFQEYTIRSDLGKSVTYIDHQEVSLIEKLCIDSKIVM